MTGENVRSGCHKDLFLVREGRGRRGGWPGWGLSLFYSSHDWSSYCNEQSHPIYLSLNYLLCSASYIHIWYPQVQSVFQKCERNGSATCNCGVSVRIGDDVFVVDRCRRKKYTCPDDSCPMEVKLYTNGAFSTGTRIFRKLGGLQYEVGESQ